MTSEKKKVVLKKSFIAKDVVSVKASVKVPLLKVLGGEKLCFCEQRFFSKKWQI